MKSVQVIDGEWIHWCKTGDYLICCDCGLSHKVDARIVNSRIELRFVVDRPMTNRDRKREGVRLVKSRKRD